MDPLLLRFLERLMVVLFGGMTIYLGFRLFLEVPEHRDSSGKVSLPWDISVVMTRVGPGVFFALFGVVAVGLALVRPLEIGPQGAGKMEASEEQGAAWLRYAADAEFRDPTARADARSLLRKEMAALNTLPGMLRGDLPEYERDAVARSIRDVKLKLMKPLWGEPGEGFGPFSEFERWAKAAEPDPPPDGMEGALALYRYGRKETKP